VRGAGVHLYDVEGREYLDVYNNVPHVGHTHPHVVAAIQRQVATLVTHTRYLHAGILEYAERLTASLPAPLDTCLFVNSGSEANDVAWRLARSATGGNTGGLVFEHAYHGITEAVAALTPSGGRPRDPRVVTLGLPAAQLRAGDTMSDAALRASARDAEQALETLAARGLKPAACYIDSGLTSSGILDPPPAWTATWAGPVRRAGALIVGDEVQYGLGRSGSHFWGFERRGLVPDIVTLGKPVGNGYPMGVVIAPRALVEAFQAKYGFFSTFGGNPVAAAAALAVLEVLGREQLMANARATGEYLTARLLALLPRHPVLESVRGVGLMIGVSVRAHGELPAPRVAKFMVNHMAAQSRVLIGTEGAHGEVLKLRPPMPFGSAHADRLVAAIEAAADALGAL
jgi:4-aminobutyrate aminotransferase-like enzyme